MGLKITTDDKGVRIWRVDKVSSNGNPYTRYFTKVSSRDGDEWVSAFIDVLFPKGTNIADKTDILIKDAFYLVSKYQDKTSMKLYIKEWEVFGVAPESQIGKTDSDGFMNVPEGIDEDELPFARTTR